MIPGYICHMDLCTWILHDNNHGNDYYIRVECNRDYNHFFGERFYLHIPYIISSRARKHVIKISSWCQHQLKLFLTCSYSKLQLDWTSCADTHKIKFDARPRGLQRISIHGRKALDEAHPMMRKKILYLLFWRVILKK